MNPEDMVDEELDTIVKAIKEGRTKDAVALWNRSHDETYQCGYKDGRDDACVVLAKRVKELVEGGA